MWMDKGLSEEVAEDKAVEQMGSPIKLGRELNKLHKPKVDWFLLILLVVCDGARFLPIIALGHTNDLLMNKLILLFLALQQLLGSCYLIIGS